MENMEYAKFAQVVGKKILTTDWFSGGICEYTVKSVGTEVATGTGIVAVAAVTHELDGDHELEQTVFPIQENAEGEYFVLYSYHGHENRVYAKSAV